MITSTELFKMANNNGFKEIVYSVFGNDVRISIPISEKHFSTDVAELDLSVRSYNGLKRSGISSIGDLFRALQENSLPSVRNLGKKSIAEIKTQYLNFCYNQLSDKKKIAFFENLIEMNSSVYKA